MSTSTAAGEGTHLENPAMIRRMKGRRLPDLSATGRRYLDGTQRARLANPGLERFVRVRRRGPRLVAVAAVLAAALIAAMVWTSTR